MYRVVVERYEKKINPKYKQGGREPYYVVLPETYEAHYGPYKSLGTAKGLLTSETLSPYDKLPRWDVVGGRIEKAEIKWTKVEL